MADCDLVECLSPPPPSPPLSPPPCSTGRTSCKIRSQKVCYEGDGYNMERATCEVGVGFPRKFTFGASGDFSSWRSCPIRGYARRLSRVTFDDVHGGARKKFIAYGKLRFRWPWH